MAVRSIAPSQNPRKDISAEYAKIIFEYNPENGRLKRKHRNNVHKSANTKYADKFADTSIHHTGYRYASVNGVGYLAHRIAWLIFYGTWPENEVDHINGNKKDNRILNLRTCESYQNGRNVKKRCNNTSGFKGVHWMQTKGRRGGWGARICTENGRIFLGLFQTPEEAHKAYCGAAKKHHKEFAHFG